MKRTGWMPFTAFFVLATFASLTLWSLASPGQAPAKPAQVAWAYKTLMGTATQSNDDELNRLGKDGWELFSIQLEGNGVVRFVFKRQN